MHNRVSRRGMMAGLAAVAPASAVAAEFAHGADAELFKLEKQFDAAVADADQLFEAQRKARKKHETVKNPRPDVLRIRPEDEALGLPGFEQHAFDRIMAATYEYHKSSNFLGPDTYWAFEVDEMRKPKWRVIEKLDLPPGVKPYLSGGIVGTRDVEPSPAARARADEIISAWDEWKAKEPREVDLDEERDWEDANSDVDDLLHEIMAIAPHTFAGLCVKAKVVAWSIRERREDEMEGMGPQDELVLLDCLLKDVFALGALSL
jgi:hypothetical protein